MKKLLTLYSVVLIVTGCAQAGVISVAQEEGWIFVTQPAGDFERNGIYQCENKDTGPVCTKATVVNY